ncbi:MAG: hypothetical protein A3H76_01470 [Candidatus Lloydbacteria bacterium RIFCSPLOWO2_02_FULL_54_12]|nr:MAG: hypothetical protein A3H76_01470 [Candidatus Lloydbacteria bacterium RIFCSPLOWO2_02_FULL_54_12]
MWLAVFVAFVIKLFLRFISFLWRISPPKVPDLRDAFEARLPRMMSFLDQLIKKFLIWGTLAFAIGIGTAI